MRLLDRYLLRELFIPLGYCLGGFLIFYVAFDLIASLNHFQEKQLLLRDVIELYVVKLPEIIVFILPIALLLSLLYTLTNHARHNELTAIRAAGISLARISLPYFIVGFILSLVVFAFNELCVPDSQAKQDQIMDRRMSGNVAKDKSVQLNFGFRNDRDQRTWYSAKYFFDTGVMLNPEVLWKDHDTDWHLRAHRAERIDGVWTFFGSTAFTTNSIVNLTNFAAQLHHPTNEISRYLTTQFSPTTIAELNSYTNGPALALEHHLVADFNELILRPDFYDAVRFAGVKLSPVTVSLIAAAPSSGATLVELNRSLLSDAYPDGLSSSDLFSVDLFRGDAASHQQMLRYINTNMLAFPDFAETPRQFANEAKFQNRLSGKLSANSAEFPIVEIQDYLKIHPQLSQKHRWWLQTQLQGRYAAPWECLVVVLIAIPFGSGSGRRNVFVGVASSIVICFVYFILLRLGLALGTGGFIPAWVAAWLPNAFFAVTGFVLLTRVR